MTIIHVQMLIEQRGNQVIGPLAKRLRCGGCQARPEQVWLVAGSHRTCHGGPGALDWAVEIKTG